MVWLKLFLAVLVRCVHKGKSRKTCRTTTGTAVCRALFAALRVNSAMERPSYMASDAPVPRLCFRALGVARPLTAPANSRRSSTGQFQRSPRSVAGRGYPSDTELPGAQPSGRTTPLYAGWTSRAGYERAPTGAGRCPPAQKEQDAFRPFV